MNPEEQALDRARYIIRAMHPEHPLRQPLLSCGTLAQVQSLMRALPICDLKMALGAVEVVEYGAPVGGLL